MSSVRSRWGFRAAAAYILVLSAAAGYVTYQAMFNRSRFVFPGSLLASLGLPWTRGMARVFESPSPGGGWPILLVSFAINSGMLYFIGSRLEQRAREPR